LPKGNNFSLRKRNTGKGRGSPGLKRNEGDGRRGGGEKVTGENGRRSANKGRMKIEREKISGRAENILTNLPLQSMTFGEERRSKEKKAGGGGGALKVFMVKLCEEISRKRAGMHSNGRSWPG